MGVYQRADSLYWWIWLDGTKRRFSSRIPIGPAGASRRASQAEAEAVYRATMGDLARKRSDIPDDLPERSFRAHATWYRDTIDVQHKGHKRGRSMIGTLIRHFEDMPLQKIDASDIEAWKTKRAGQVQRRTVNRELDILKPLLRSAVPKYLAKSPADNVFRFRVPRFPPVVTLSEEAEDRMLAHASAEERAILILALDTLMRKGDCRTLSRVNDHGTHIVVPNPKGGQLYTVPVSLRLRVALDTLPDNGQPYYFSRVYAGKRQPISGVSLHTMFVNLCVRAGVPNGRKAGGVTFHGLRHTGASRAARHVKLSVVKRLGNWSSLAMLDRYDHPDDPDLLRAVEAIGSRRTHAEASADEKPSNQSGKRAS